ncbi:MAG: hypothetical protein ACR652_00415 [Methylocystis sp.]|uniref:hypothetical protein n=1 Tax=Methylocystis sp. TaxID=1911079 RepID=UPI003DA62D1C
MGAIDTAFKAAWRDYVTDGVPASGARNTPKSDARALGATIEAYFAAPLTIPLVEAERASLPSVPAGTIWRLGGSGGNAYQLGVVDAFGGIPAIRLRRVNGTVAAPTAIQSGDDLGELEFAGYYTTGGAAFSTKSVNLRAEATQNWTSTTLGSRLVAQVTPNGSATPVDSLWLEQDSSLRVKGALGYQTGVGAGGTVTQATNKATGVTLNAPTGEIVLAATGTTLYNTYSNTSFVLTNSFIGANDTVVVSHKAGGTSGAYWFGTRVSAGAVVISVFSAVSLAEAITIQFSIIKGAVN